MLPILLAFAFIALLLFIAVTGQPDDFVCLRRAKMAVPPERIFPRVNELRQWEGWNPWGKLDPNCRVTYDGPAAGAGASYSWAGNNKVGAGRSTIIESRPNELVRLRLEFMKPMVATNTAELTFRSEGHQTIVTWSMAGKTPLGGKIFGLFVNCEQMCGRQFEQGLTQMKALVEAGG